MSRIFNIHADADLNIYYIILIDCQEYTKKLQEIDNRIHIQTTTITTEQCEHYLHKCTKSGNRKGKKKIRKETLIDNG